MNVQECYKKIGDYEAVCQRAGSEKTVEKLLLLYLEDPNFELFFKALEEQDHQRAFRAIHTLKGVARSLSFTRMDQISTEITELLRDGRHCELTSELAKLREAQKEILDCISQR